MLLKTKVRAKFRALLTHDVAENKAQMAVTHDVYENKWTWLKPQGQNRRWRGRAKTLFGRSQLHASTAGSMRASQH